MTKTRVTLAIMFLLTFAAGMAVGLWGRGPQHGEKPGPSWLTSALDLTPEQEQEMLKIWAGLDRTSRQDEFEKRRALTRQRDEAVRALVPVDQHGQLEKIYETHSQQTNELSEQRRKAFDAAVEKTKAILTPDQRKKYEQVLARRPMGRRPGSGGPGGGSGGGTGPGAGSGTGAPVEWVLPRSSTQPSSGDAQPSDQAPTSEPSSALPQSDPAVTPSTQPDVLR